jgi:hypothetical protein
MVETIAVLYLNSANSTSKDLSKGRAFFVMNPVMEIPRDVKIKVAVQQFSFTNFFVNISAALVNNKFYYTNDALTPDKYTVTIPDGSYNVSDLSDAVNVGVINNGHTDGLITLTPDFSTNKVIFSISAAGWQLYFKAGTSYVLLGTTLNQKIPAAGLTTGAYSELAPGVGTFNSITQLYLHSSLTNSSVFSGVKSDVIASITPTASIGSVQNTETYNLVWIPSDFLNGSILNSINLYVTDQNGNPVNLSDDYGTTILIGSTE